MGSCQECGGRTSLDYKLCKSCWQGHTQGTALTRRPAVPFDGSTPWDVVCDYVYPTYVPSEAVECNAAIGEPCKLSEYVPWLDVRVVYLGVAGNVEVHETRFRKWRSQYVILEDENQVPLFHA